MFGNINIVIYVITHNCHKIDTILMPSEPTKKESVSSRCTLFEY